MQRFPKCVLWHSGLKSNQDCVTASPCSLAWCECGRSGEKQTEKSEVVTCPACSSVVISHYWLGTCTGLVGRDVPGDEGRKWQLVPCATLHLLVWCMCAIGGDRISDQPEGSGPEPTRRYTERKRTAAVRNRTRGQGCEITASTFLPWKRPSGWEKQWRALP